MSPPTRYTAADFLPLVAFVVGTVLSAWRFRAHDPLGGLAFGLGGTVVMIGLGVWSRDSP